MNEFLNPDDNPFLEPFESEPDIEIDFRLDLLLAMRNAKFVDLTASGQHPQASLDELERHHALKAKSGDALIEGSDTSLDPSAEVYTNNPHEFPILYRQALELAFPSATRERIDEEVRLVTDHEMKHAAAAIMIGKNPHLGLRMMKIHTRPGKYAYRVMAFTAFSGQDMTKADCAFIAAAGGDLAERDLAVIESLGYSSPEEAIETHPIFRQP